MDERPASTRAGPTADPPVAGPDRKRAGRRATALMAVLLVLVLGYLTYPLWFYRIFYAPPPPLDGTNAVSGLRVAQDAQGRWIAEYDYFYTGAPAGVDLRTQLVGAPTAEINQTSGNQIAQRGRHHVSTEISRPSVYQAFNTTEVAAEMRLFNGDVVSRDRVTQAIGWTDMPTWGFLLSVRGQPPQALLKRAVALIDRDDAGGYPDARQLLDHLIARDPRFDPAYVEMARIAMKTHWGVDGLHQAETLLQSALQIRPDSAAAKTLLAYVYVHQGRYVPAEALLVEASQAQQPSAWLWSDWGELLALQGKFDPAIDMYRKAILAPRDGEGNDRARRDAYLHLLPLLAMRKDVDGMEAVHRERTAESGPASCEAAEYARFALDERADAEAAIRLAQPAIGARCSSVDVRETLGLAYYVRWGTANTEDVASLSQARVFLPSGPRPLYLLSTHDATVPVARKLIEAGEAIDQRDDRHLDALAYALGNRDVPAARRLLGLGARPETPVGADEMPVALLPVLQSDLDGIQLMRRSGVDYATLRFRGTTAVEIARNIGDPKLIRALDPKARSL